MTGTSNFDISEYILIQLLKFISGTHSAMAFLIKTSVARKLFQHIAKHKMLVSDISVRKINAKKHFKTSVDAYLFSAHGTSTIVKTNHEYTCSLYAGLTASSPYKMMGIIGNKLVSDITSYSLLFHIDQGSEFKWRSGVKHDASEIMEFKVRGNRLVNGLSEFCHLPFDHLYPMYKNFQISKKVSQPPTQYMLITQKKIGEETRTIEVSSPDTWKYLMKHAKRLDHRKSSIYKNSARFAMFGVGKYTFMPWKTVISGLHKNLTFTKIGCYQDKPMVVNDTCYMLGFELEEQANFVLKMLSSDLCGRFIESILFLDQKRPVTIALLNRISIQAIATDLNCIEKYHQLFHPAKLQF